LTFCIAQRKTEARISPFLHLCAKWVKKKSAKLRGKRRNQEEKKRRGVPTVRVFLKKDAKKRARAPLFLNRQKTKGESSPGQPKGEIATQSNFHA